MKVSKHSLRSSEVLALDPDYFWALTNLKHSIKKIMTRVRLHVLLWIIGSIQYSHSSPSFCRVTELQQKENAESEMDSFRMNNAATNEAAALCHATVGNYKYKKRGSAGDMRPMITQTQLYRMSPDITLSSEPWRHLTSPSPLKLAQLSCNPRPQTRPKLLHFSAVLIFTNDLWVINGLPHSLTFRHNS